MFVTVVGAVGAVAASNFYYENEFLRMQKIETKNMNERKRDIFIHLSMLYKNRNDFSCVKRV